MKTLFVFLQRLLPQHWLSRMAGRLAGSEDRLLKNILIRFFCLFFPVNLAEAERTSVREYRSFNDFFTRSLCAGARTIGGHLCSPADGLVAAVGELQEGRLIQAKGMSYSLGKLLADADLGQLTGGSFITIYLAPHNYHRVHAPCRGELTEARYIPGRLFSVNQTSSAKIPDLLATNERLVCRFSTGTGMNDKDVTETGTMYCVMVGAMLVAGIKPAWSSAPCKPGLEVHTKLRKQFEQGDEIGQFQMGSTVVLVFDQRVDFIVEAGQAVSFGQPVA